MKTELEKYKETLDNIIFNRVQEGEIITIMKNDENEFDEIKFIIKKPNVEYERTFIIHRCANYIDFLNNDLLKDYNESTFKKFEENKLISETLCVLKDGIKKANELIKKLENK